MGLQPMPHGGDIPGIDADAERRNALALLGAIVAFCISAYQSANELRYAISGVTAEAIVGRVSEVREPSRGRPKRFLRAEVRFDEQGAPRDAVIRAPLGTPLTAGERADVQFIPGRADWVRLAGQRAYGWMALFAVSVTWIVWSLLRLAREANQPIGKSRRRR